MMRPTFLLTYSPLRSRYPNLWKRGMEKGSRGDLMKTDMNQEDRREKDGTKNPSQVPISRGHCLLERSRRIEENFLKKNIKWAELQKKIDREKNWRKRMEELFEKYGLKKLIDRERTDIHKAFYLRTRQNEQKPILVKLTERLMLLKKKVEELCVQGFQVGGDPVAIHLDLLVLNIKLGQLSSFTSVHDTLDALFAVELLLDYLKSSHPPLRPMQSEDEEEVASLLIAEDLQEIIKATNEIIHWLSVAYRSTVVKIIERSGTATATITKER